MNSISNKGLKEEFYKNWAKKYRLFVDDGKGLGYFETDVWIQIWEWIDQAIKEARQEGREEIIKKIKKRMYYYSAQGELPDKSAFFAFYGLLEELTNSKRGKGK